MVDHIDFPSSTKELKRLCFDQIFYVAGKFLKKQAKKAFLDTFWKCWSKYRVFFGARSPLKISIYWPRRFSHQKWISQNSTKGDPFGRLRGKTPERKKASAPAPPPPKSAADQSVDSLGWKNPSAFLGQKRRSNEFIIGHSTCRKIKTSVISNS